MIKRVAALREQVHTSAPGETLLAEIEDTLSEGYAHALTGDAWSMRSEQRLHELINDSRSALRGRDLRHLANQHAAFERDVIALRRALAELRQDRDRLQARSHTTSV